MLLVKPSTMLYYICKYSKFSCIKNKKRGENALLFKYCVRRIGNLAICHLVQTQNIYHKYARDVWRATNISCKLQQIGKHILNADFIFTLLLPTW